MRNTKPNAHRLRSAFTLAECLVASIVLAVAVVGVTAAIVASQRQTAAQEDDATAVALARQLIEEVVSLPIVLPDGSTGVAGWPASTNRSLYDTIDDYNGYTDTVTTDVARATELAAKGNFTPVPPKPSFAVAIDAPLAAQQYRRRVAVSFPTVMFGASVSAGDFAVVTVTIQGNSPGKGAQLTRLVARTNITR
ncbi:hypothetical protein [Fontivita pretiosa]|uniref:hypothetical protein n=1 Tax=Fontivita pretiosa TaxID=2989684 RepID=UPI003D182D88